jgi:hypothetical protein
MITRKLKFDNIPSLLLSALSSSLSLRPGWNLVSLTLSALIKAAAAKIGKPVRIVTYIHDATFTFYQPHLK